MEKLPMTREIISRAPIYNYYGTPELIKEDDKFYFSIEDCDGYAAVKVSAEFAESFIREFGPAEKHDKPEVPHA